MNDDSRAPQPSSPGAPDTQASQPRRASVRRNKLVPFLIATTAIIGIVSLVGVFIIRPGPFSSRSASSTPGATPAPPSKQIVRILDQGPNAGDIDSLDPATIGYPSDYDRAQLVFPSLITQDDMGTPVDWAARSHETSSDGLTWTFHLRSGMKWSDGAAIDANTFAYSINRALDPCTGSDVASYLYNIKGAADFHKGTCPSGAKVSADTLVSKSIVVADPLTLMLRLEKPEAYFLGELSYSTSWAVPKQLIDQYGQTKWTDHLADGTGFGGNLFKVTRWDHAGHFTLAANSAFWGQKPLVRKIEWTLYQEQETAWADYLAGAGDIAFPQGAELTQAKTLGGYTETPTLTVNFLRVNWALAPFDDVRVRNAFSLAIDRTAVATAVLHGGAIPTMHMLIQGLPGYNPNLRNAAGDSGAATNVANVAKARELAQAYATEKCGGDFAKCTPIVLTSYANKPTTNLLAQAFQQEWQTAFPGWQITLQGLASALVHKGAARLQFAIDGWAADYDDPQDFLSTLWATDAPYNPSSVHVPAADALLQQADVSSDARGRLSQYQQAEQLLVDQGAFIAFAQPVFAWVVHPSAKLVKWRVNAQQGTSLVTWQQAYVAA